MNTLKSLHSFLCLEEMQFSLLILSFHLKCYLGNDLNVLSLEALKNMFHIATENLHRAHDSTLPKQLPHHFTEGDTVLIKNHTAGPFDPKYIGNYRIMSFWGNQVELIPSTGGKVR